MAGSAEAPPDKIGLGGPALNGGDPIGEAQRARALEPDGHLTLACLMLSGAVVLLAIALARRATIPA